MFAWGISFLGRSRGQMAITSQMIYARVVTNWMERRRRWTAAERAEEAETGSRLGGASSRAWSISAIRSSVPSSPTEMRTTPSPSPIAARPSGPIAR